MFNALAAMRNIKHRLYTASKDARRLARAAAISLDPMERRIREQVSASMRLPALQESARRKGSVWAVAMVRNEADIIELTIRHLLDQGVDGILVVDNGSQDDTPCVLARLAAEDPRVHVGEDCERAYYQAQKMTFLAAAAARAGADWIVPFDADEFWFGADQSLVGALRDCPSPVAVASVHNIFPTDPLSRVGGPDWAVDQSPARLQKVAFRWHPLARLHHGNHSVDRTGQPVSVLRVLHAPWRSWEQFHQKIRAGAAALDAAGPRQRSGGDHWRDLADLDDAGLFSAWDQLLKGRAPVAMEWIPRGELRPCDPWGRDRWLDAVRGEPGSASADAGLRIKIYTRSMSDFLYSRAMSFVDLPYPKVRLLGTGALEYLQRIIEDEDADLVINVDEDAFITDIEALKDLIRHVWVNGYANAGMPDGGVVAHRDFNPRSTNPYFNVLNTQLIRQRYDSTLLEEINLEGDEDLDNFPRELIRGPYRPGYHEPFDPLFVWIGRNYPVLYLDAETHRDGISTILKTHDGRPFLFHSWYTRTYGRDWKNTRRINRLINEAAATNPSGRRITRWESLWINVRQAELAAAKKAYLVLKHHYNIVEF